VLKIRLSRGGSKQNPHYRVVVSESGRTPSARSVDTIGIYAPGSDPAQVRIDLTKADAWIRKGARPSETVQSLLERARAAQKA
jgi:small subunit ribosomal protein S16